MMQCEFMDVERNAMQCVCLSLDRFAAWWSNAMRCVCRVMSEIALVVDRCLLSSRWLAGFRLFMRLKLLGPFVFFTDLDRVGAGVAQDLINC